MATLVLDVQAVVLQDVVLVVLEIVATAAARAVVMAAVRGATVVLENVTLRVLAVIMAALERANPNVLDVELVEGVLDVREVVQRTALENAAKEIAQDTVQAVVLQHVKRRVA